MLSCAPAKNESWFSSKNEFNDSGCPGSGTEYIPCKAWCIRFQLVKNNPPKTGPLAGFYNHIEKTSGHEFQYISTNVLQKSMPHPTGCNVLRQWIPIPVS
jgi:hypothetical protein